MIDHRSAVDAVTDRKTLRSGVKLALLAAWVVLVVSLLSWIPGIDRVVPHTPVTIAAVIGAIASMVIVGVLLVLAPTTATLVGSVISGPERIVGGLAAAAYWFVLLVAVLVAHTGLTALFEPFLGGAEWLYDTVFLLLALPPVIFIGVRLYTVVDPGAEMVTTALVGDEATDESSTSAQADSDA